MPAPILFDFSKARLGGSKADLPTGVYLPARITKAVYTEVDAKVYVDGKDTGRTEKQNRLEISIKIEHDGVTVNDVVRITPKMGWLLARFLDAVKVDVTKLNKALTEKFIQDKLQDKLIEVKYAPDPATDGSGTVYRKFNDARPVRVAPAVVNNPLADEDEDDADDTPFDPGQKSLGSLGDDEDDDE